MPLGNVEQIILRITGESSGGERALDRIAKRLRTFGAVLTAVSDAALVAFYKLGKGGAELELLEQKFASVSKAFGQDMDTLLDKWQEVSRGAISRAELMRKANYLALTGIPLSELEWMLQAVMNASAATGRSMEDLFDRLALGLARSSKLLLDDLGIIVGVTAANEAYAASIGKSADELTVYEEKLAFVQAARAAAARQEQILGKATETSAIAIQRARASLQDAGDTIRKAFAPIVGAAANVVTKLAQAVQSIPEPVLRLIATLATILALVGAVIGPLLTVMGLLPIIASALSAIGGMLPYLAPILALLAALGAAVALLAKAWKENWGGIQETVRDVLDTIRPWIDAIVRNALGWIQMIRIQLRGIVEAIRGLLEPALERLRELFGDGLGVKEFMSTLRDLVSVVGSVIYSVLSAIRLILEGNADKAYMPLKNAALNVVTFLVLVWRKHIKDAATYGWNLIVNFANGIVRAANSVLSRVATWVGNMLARFWASGSPPKEGPLSNIIQWGRGVAETFLRAFGLADFSILRDSMAPVREILRSAVDLGEIDEPASIRVFRDVRGLAMELIADFRKTGEISDQVLGNIADKLGEGGEEYAKYLRLQLEHQQALAHLQDVEGRVAKARAAGFIPKALQDELDAAQEDVDKKKEAVDWQREYLMALQDGVDLQRDLVAALKEMIKALKELGKAKPEELAGGGGGGAGEGVAAEEFGGFAGFSEEFQNTRKEVEEFFAGFSERFQKIREGVEEWFKSLPNRLRITLLQIAAILALTFLVIREKIRITLLQIAAIILWQLLIWRQAIIDWFTEQHTKLGQILRMITAIVLAKLLIWRQNIINWLAQTGLKIIGWFFKQREKLRQNLLMILAIILGQLLIWRQKIEEKINAIGQWIQDRFDDAMTWIRNQWDRVLTAGSDLLNQFLEGLKLKWAELQTWFEESLAAIPEWIGVQWENLKTAGENLIGGFLEGLRSKWAELKTWFQNRLSDIPGWAKKIFGIGSPSKLFYKYGQWVVEGFERGFDVSRILDKVRSIAPSLNLTAGGLGGQQIYVVQIGDLSLPDVRDGRDAQSLLRELLEQASGQAALRGAIPGGLMG